MLEGCYTLAMNTTWSLIIAMVLCVGLNLWCEKRRIWMNGFVFKTAASLSFFSLAVHRWDGIEPYGLWILAALGCCVIGDMLLVFKKTFGLGLAAFLLGHLLFCVAFGHVLPVARWSWPWLPPLAGWGGLVLLWLWKDLGRMKGPVVVYVGAICTMFWAAVSVGLSGGTILIPCGAALFTLSDLGVARNRFKSPGYVNRAWGLPTYYLAQTLLALSVGQV